MTRRNIDVDDRPIWEVMHRYGIATKKEAMDMALLEEDTPLATSDTVVSELLSGPTNEQRANERMRMLDRCRFYPARPLFDSTSAAGVYRTCRRSGFSPRHLNDCFIAAVALEHGLVVLHKDRDFDRIAEVTGLLVTS